MNRLCLLGNTESVHQEQQPMKITRAPRIDPTLTRWYHGITRCLRHAFFDMKIGLTASHRLKNGSFNLRTSWQFA